MPYYSFWVHLAIGTETLKLLKGLLFSMRQLPVVSELISLASQHLPHILVVPVIWRPECVASSHDELTTKPQLFKER